MFKPELGPARPVDGPGRSFHSRDMQTNAPKEVEQAVRNPITLDENLVRKAVDMFGSFAVNLLAAIIILAVTFWLAKTLSGVVRRALTRVHRHNPDPTLASFGASLTRYLIIFVGVIAVLQQLGVQTTSILAVLGAASLAVGLALQGTLSNVAAGVMLLIFRPYRVGDTIETATRKGVVTSLDLFVTELATGDNTKVIVPNGKVFGDVILNYTHYPRHRADLVWKVPYKTDIPAMLEALNARIAADPRIRKDPPPVVEITAMSEAFVEGAVRVWTAREDEGSTKSDLLLAIRILSEDAQADLPPMHPPAPKPTASERRRKRQHISLRGLARDRISGRRDPRSPPKA